NGEIQVINRAGGRGEVPDVIDGDIEENEFGDVLLDELEVGVAAQVRDVVHAAGDEVIYADDFVAARQQQVGEVGAEKTGGAGDDGGGVGAWGLFFSLHQTGRMTGGCKIPSSKLQAPEKLQVSGINPVRCGGWRFGLEASLELGI